MQYNETTIMMISARLLTLWITDFAEELGGNRCEERFLALDVSFLNGRSQQLTLVVHNLN